MFPKLEGNIKHASAHYGIKLLRTANQLLGKKQKYYSPEMQGARYDLSKLKDRVYHKILEDCDDRNIVSNDLLVQACLLFDEFQYD